MRFNIFLICYCLNAMSAWSVREHWPSKEDIWLRLDDIYTNLYTHSGQQNHRKNVTITPYYQTIPETKQRKVSHRIVRSAESEDELKLKWFEDAYPERNNHVKGEKFASEEEPNDALNLTAIEKPEISCHTLGFALAMTGNSVKISDLPSPLRCAPDTTLQLIAIFATDTVFIDQDLLLKGSNVFLAIMAPVWFVQGQRKFELNGIKPPAMKKAPSGENPGDKGKDGENGTPGRPGGNFLGVGEKFVNGEKLTITTSGSIGGDGQEGGDGAEGKDGDSRTPVECSTESITPCSGHLGSTGGAGGNGGLAGVGGLPGRITIVDMKEDSQIKVILINGISGVPGNGGHGGLGGRNGGVYKIPRSSEVVFIPNIMRAPSGPQGNTNFSDKHVESAPSLDDRQITHVFNLIMTEYKMYLLDNMKSRQKRNEIFGLLVNLYTNENVRNTLDTSLVGICNDFLEFDKYFNSLYGKVDLLLFYKSFQTYIEKLCKEVDPESENFKVLLSLYAATLSKISFLENLADAKFIANLDNFLDMFLENIKKLKEIDSEVVITDNKNQNKKRIDKQILEAKDTLEHRISPMVDEYVMKNKEDITKFADDTNSVVSEVKSLMAPNILPPILQMNFLINTVKTAVKILNVLMDTSKSFGDAIDSSNDVAGPLSGKSVNWLSDGPSDADNLIKTIKNVILEKPRKQIEIFQYFVEQKINRPSFFDTDNEFLDSLRSLKKEMNSWNIYENITEKFLQEIFELCQKYFAPGLTMVSSGLVKLMESGIILDKTQSTNELFIEACVSITEGSGNKMGALKSYEKSIETALQPILKSLRENFAGNDLQKPANHKLIEIQEQIKNYLQEIINVLETYTRNFETELELIEQIHSIMSVVGVMKENFQRLKGFQSEKALTNYIGNLKSARFKSIHVKNEDLSQVLSKIERSLQSNVILLQYTKFLDQLKMFVFPMAKTFLKNFDVPKLLELKNSSEEYLKSVVAQVETFKVKIYETKVYATEYDRLKHRAKFYPNTTNGPFHIWYGTEHKESIRRLFNGEEVIFQADVSKHRENAVKFNRIDLILKAHNKNTQPRLNSILDDFLLSMTHMGVNYYRCNNQTYMIKTESQEFQFSFKRRNKHPIESNLVYDKLQDGDFMLSPFTTWKIRIINVTAPNYELLKTFTREVDLVFVGDAEYFVSNKEICEFDLEEYYQISDMLQKTS